jgi:hypothetical protein
MTARKNSAYRSGCHIAFIFNKLLTTPLLSVHNSVHFFKDWRCGTGQHPAAGQDIQGLGERLQRNARKRIQWPSGGRFLIEWRENGKRFRASAGDTPSEALEAQKRKRLELDAKDSGLELSGLDKEDESLPLQKAVEAILKDVRTFRKPLTHQKYE